MAKRGVRGDQQPICCRSPRRWAMIAATTSPQVRPWHGPIPQRVQDLSWLMSLASGISIVAGCGFYVETYRNDNFLDSSVGDLAERIITDVRIGIGDSDIPAGIIGEIGCSDTWSEIEQRAVHAAVIAQSDTGASLNIHPPRDVSLLHDVVRSIERFGGDLSRCIFSHIDRTIFTLDDLYRLADTGCVIEFDFFGIESSYYPFQAVDLPNDAMRLDMVRSLIDRGHISQITLSQDICTKTRLTRYGGHGYGHLFANVLPVMKRKGFSDEEIDTLIVATPRRLLSITDG